MREDFRDFQRAKKMARMRYRDMVSEKGTNAAIKSFWLALAGSVVLAAFAAIRIEKGEEK